MNKALFAFAIGMALTSVLPQLMGIARAFEVFPVVSFLLTILAVMAWLIAWVLSIYRGSRYQFGRTGHVLLTLFRSSTWLSISLAFLLGVGWVTHHWREAENNALPETADKVDTDIRGVIKQFSSDQDPVYFDLHEQDAASELTGRKWLVSCYRCRSLFDAMTWQDGQVWRLNVSLRPIGRFANPGGFDYRYWMTSKGYAGQAYMKKEGHEWIAATNERNVFLEDIHRIRESIKVQTHEALMGRSGEGWIRALLFGDKSKISAEDKRVLGRTGLGHLFVVSGLHIGLVFMAVTALTYWLARPLLVLASHNVFAHRPVRASGRLASVLPVNKVQRLAHAIQWLIQSGVFAYGMGLMAACLYAWLSGFQVPAQRALIMAIALVLLWFFARRISPVHVLTAAIGIVVMIDPLAFLRVGSWLSFGIVGGLIWTFNGSALRGWRALCSAQFSAFCVGGSILILFGMALSPLGAALNLIAIPLFSLLLLPVVLLGASLNGLLGLPQLLVWSGEALAHLFGGLHYVSLSLPNFQGWLHVGNQWMLLMVLFLLLCPLQRSFKWVLWPSLIAAVLVRPETIDSGDFRVHILDVGQGSAALIQTHSHNILVDTGRRFASGMGISDYVIMPFLSRLGVQRIHRVHVTHEDSDHNGGLAVMRDWGPKVQSIVGQDLCEYRRWNWDSVTFTQFQASGYQNGNNGSCLLKVASHAGSILFTGDIEKEAEYRLVQDHPKDLLSADALVVAHHGSRTSTTSAFLKAVNPEWAIISAGRFNGYGHPHPQVESRLKAHNVQVLRTFSHGTVEVEANAGHSGLLVSTYRPN